MSQYIDDIVKSLRETPQLWTKSDGGVKNGNIAIKYARYPRFMSLVDVYIDGMCIPSTYMDKWRLEVSVAKWYSKIPLCHLV